MKISFFSDFIFRIPSYTLNILKSYTQDFLPDKIENDDFLMYSIHLSSHSLYSQKTKNQINQNVLNNILLKYTSRIGYRTIPYGTFSGLGLVESKAVKNSNGEFTIINKNIKSFIDLELKYKVNESNKPSVNYERNQFYLNPTLKYNNGKYRYLYFQINHDGNHNYNYISFQNNIYIKKIFALIKKKKTINEIINFITKDNFIEFEDVKKFMFELIDNKILISDFEPCTIGFNQFQQNINKKINYFLEKYDNLSFNDKNKILNFVYKQQLQKGIISKNDNLLYVNTYFLSDGYFTHAQIKLIKNSISILNQFLVRFNKENYKTIENFINNFEKRFEDEPISILDAFDPEKGEIYEYYGNHGTEFELMDNFFLKKINKNYDKKIIEINDKELNQILVFNKTHRIDKSPTGCARVSLYKNGDSDVIYIKSLSPHSPNRILSRFTNSNNEINNLCSEIAKYENDKFPDSILAEIDFLPNIKNGNVINRTRFRKYRIVIHNCVNSDFCIPINDLFIKVNNGELIIFSKKLKKKIIPCFSTALNTNTTNIPPMVKFLIDFYYYQFNHTVGMLNIVNYHRYYNHIPRIMYKNIILSKESWLVNAHDFIYVNRIKKHYDKNDIENAIINFNNNRKKLEIPRFFEYVIDDIENYVDSENEQMIRSFLIELNNRKEMLLNEVLINSYQSIIKAKNGEYYNNEFFIPFKNEEFNFIDKQSTKSISKINRKYRFFIPGSEWMYYKIYINQQFSNKFLISLSNILKSLLNKGEIKQFFYLMFIDSEFHIRLRININIKYYYKVIDRMTIFFSTLYEQLYLKNILIDTYIREIERYSLKNINLIENIFYLDSELSMKFIFHSYKKNIDTWIYSIRLVDIYLSNVFDNINDKLVFVREMRLNLKSKIEKRDNSITKWVNERYLLNIDKINYLFNDKTNEYFENFNNSFTNLFINLEFSKEFSKKYYIGNIIHMHIARITNKQNILYEYLVYSILDKILSEKKYKNR